jgi:cyclic pyranopterin phosphate synthase
MEAHQKLTHLDESGKARMVDVGDKTATPRRAVAEAFVLLLPETLRAIAEERVGKGEVLAVARVAGVMAAKRTGDLIPLCHPLPVDSVSVDFDVPAFEPGPGEQRVRLHVKAVATVTAKTGVEMEALTAVTVAALTVYDMCKAIDKGIVIDGVRLLEKTGGKSGDYHAPDRP